jgi:hypothetical protein
MDFGEATIILAGEPIVVHLFHLRLSASVKGVTLAFLGEDQQALLEGHCTAFERLDGYAGGRCQEGRAPVNVATRTVVRGV